jgi:hypothetical protein
MNNFYLKFRPSSHSDDGTIVATFETSEMAKWVAAILDAGCLGEKVFLVVYHEVEGSIDALENQLERMGAKKVANYDRYQELIITVQLPPGISDDSLPIIVDRRIVDLVKKLRKLGATQKTRSTHGTQETKFWYSGKTIFEDDQFSFQDGTTITKLENVKVNTKMG